MERVQARREYTKKYPFLAFSLGMIAITFGFVLLLSPLSPLRADTNVADWNGNFFAYNVGDMVSYNGQEYTCIQGHTSEPNWNPIDTPALWKPVANAAAIPISSPVFTGNMLATDGSGNVILITPTPTPSNLVSQPIPAYVSNGQSISVSVTFYTDQGLMADGLQTHIGACAVFTPQFPLGTELALYDPSNPAQPAYTCTAEDTGTAICQNDVDVALPGQVAKAIQLGKKPMLAQITGFDQTVAQEAAANHPTSQGCEG